MQITHHNTPSDLHPETLAAFEGDELRARIFHDKYALRDADGRVVERTPDQMWQRIARELASVEAPERQEEWRANFNWLLGDFRLIPGGRIMHGAGNPKRVTLLNCFPAGTPVLSKRGFLSIEQILPGDEVLTHRDRFNLVTHAMERKVDEPLVELTCFYLGDQPIRCTSDHRFLALGRDGKVGWIPARQLTREHYIKVGRVTETIPLKDLDVMDYLEGGALEDDEGNVHTARPYVGGQGAVGVAESRRVKRRVALDEDFGRWLGYFIAEGGVTENSVYFTLSKDESYIAAEIAALTQKVFGVAASIQTRAGQPRHWMRVYAHSKLLVRFVRSFFNARVHSTDKLLPHWFLRVSTRVQKAFVGAVFVGDGVFREKSTKLFLANPELIRQIYAILLRLNVIASIRWEGMLRFTKHRGMWITVGTQRYVESIKAWARGELDADSHLAEVDKNYSYRVSDGDLFVKIKRLRQTDPVAQTVYDLTVEDDHSFTAGFLCTHNCYVIPVKDDSIESIFEWMKEAARTYSLGGGVGTDISVLRPRGAPVNNAARSSTGSVSFMELFSLTTGTIGQSGRRGALMITIADDHPDVLDFIKIKRNMHKVRFANISVRISDAFMRAVEDDGPWDLAFSNERAAFRRTVRARDLWRELIAGARDHAEPGVIFWDTVKRWSTSEYNGMDVITTNPCSEIPLEPYGVCDLGNLNLCCFVKDEFTSQARVDWEQFERALRFVTRFLDNVLTYNADKHPLPQQREASLYSRRIGVGFTALGDMLIKLGLRYDSNEAVSFVDGLFDRIKNIVYDESVNLAIEKGAFPGYDAQVHLASPFIQTLSPKVRERIERHGLRNVALLTVPPVGSGAALAGVTSGIEPIFDLSYIRRSESLSQEIFTVYHPLVRVYMTRFGVEREEDLPDAFVTAHQISPEMRVRMQAAIQKHIDHSISSTVNLAHDTPVEEVERIYFQAWKHGLKGITVYRAGSRENILTAKSEAKPNIYAASKEVLEDLYDAQGKSLSEIARAYGTNTGIVHRVFTRFGIQRRKFSEAADELATKSVALSTSLLELIEGELLGDGSLRRYKNGALFAYTSKYYDYAVWLTDQFEREGIECSEIGEYQHEAGNVVFKFQTLTYKELGDLYDRWYNAPASKRLPQDFALTPIKLRQWFIGDGSNVTQAKAKYIACYSAFSAEDKARLKAMLEQILGRSLIFHESGNKIYINADVVRRLFDYVGSCPVSCYEYKWKGGEHVLSAREPGIAQFEVTVAEASAQARSDLPAAPVQTDVERPFRITPRPRPKVTSGRTERIETPRGRVYVVVNEDEMGICEVFVHSLDVEAEAIGRMASLALRGGLDARDIIEQLWRVQSKEVAFDRSADGTVVRVTTIAQAVALALGRVLYGDAFTPDRAFPRADALPEPGPRVRQEALRFAAVEPAPAERAKTAVLAPVAGGNGSPADDGDGIAAAGAHNGIRGADIALEFIGICPDCGASLVHENGCATCRQCGYSRC